jgi:hypothetical protein
MGRKSLSTLSTERQRVLEVIQESERGMDFHGLAAGYQRRVGRRIPPSTLRKRLAELLDEGLIVRDRPYDPTYRSTVAPDRGTPGRESTAAQQLITGLDREERSSAIEHGADPGLAIQLSDAARAAQALLRRPRAERPPVNYHPEFLDEYQPGMTWYLSASLRDTLRATGATAYEGQAAGTYARDIMQRLIIDLSWGSSRLEGSKYTRIDTEELFAGQDRHEGSTTDRQMILNHKDAIEYLVENADQIEYDRQTVLGLHALLSENLMNDPEDEGTLRRRPIGVGASVYTPTDVPQVIEERFNLILEKARLISDPFEQSFFVMVHLPYLQPFSDVNKRTSRLAANISLIKANLCPLSFVDVPERLYTDGTLAVYEQRDVALLRDVYAWAYRRSCDQFTALRGAMGTPDPIRLHYRLQLRSVIGDIITERVWPKDDDLRARGKGAGIPDSDLEGFLSAARRDLGTLRREKIAKYALRPSQFDEWIASIGNARTRTG